MAPSIAFIVVVHLRSHGMPLFGSSHCPHCFAILQVRGECPDVAAAIALLVQCTDALIHGLMRPLPLPHSLLYTRVCHPHHCFVFDRMRGQHVAQVLKQAASYCVYLLSMLLR